jgi:hypothetical protein
MAITLSESGTLNQEQEEFTTVSTTFNYQVGRKFPVRPVAITHPESIVQTSAKASQMDVRKYYISPRLTGSLQIVLPIQPYELGTVDEQLEVISSDNIAIHNLARSLTELAFRFVQVLPSMKYGKFQNPLVRVDSSDFPQAQPRFTDLEIEDADLTEDEEPLCRGVFTLPSSTDVLFSKNIEVAIGDLPSWEPHIIIDSYRLEDDDEDDDERF